MQVGVLKGVIGICYWCGSLAFPETGGRTIIATAIRSSQGLTWFYRAYQYRGFGNHFPFSFFAVVVSAHFHKISFLKKV
jgi:hypothetical protein